jgi:hypothetical protein
VDVACDGAALTVFGGTALLGVTPPELRLCSSRSFVMHLMISPGSPGVSMRIEETPERKGLAECLLL